MGQHVGHNLTPTRSGWWGGRQDPLYAVTSSRCPALPCCHQETFLCGPCMTFISSLAFQICHLCLERKKIPLPHSLSMVTREGLCPSCCERPQVLPAAESRGLLATRSPGKLHSCIITFLRCCGTRTACCGGSWKRCVFSCSRRAGPSEGCRLQVKHRRVCCSSVLTRARFPGGGTFMGVWCIVDTWYM